MAADVHVDQFGDASCHRLTVGTHDGVGGGGSEQAAGQHQYRCGASPEDCASH
jgi:hypothetical protein